MQWWLRCGGGRDGEVQKYGAAVDLDLQRKGKRVVIKNSTRQTIFPLVVVCRCLAAGRHRPAVLKCRRGPRRCLNPPQANIVRLTRLQEPGCRKFRQRDFQSAQQYLE